MPYRAERQPGARRPLCLLARSPAIGGRGSQICSSLTSSRARKRLPRNRTRPAAMVAMVLLPPGWARLGKPRYVGVAMIAMISEGPFNHDIGFETRHSHAGVQRRFHSGLDRVPALGAFCLHVAQGRGLTGWVGGGLLRRRILDEDHRVREGQAHRASWRRRTHQGARQGTQKTRHNPDPRDRRGPAPVPQRTPRPARGLAVSHPIRTTADPLRRASALLIKHTATAAANCSPLNDKTVSPHTLRHYVDGWVMWPAGVFPVVGVSRGAVFLSSR